MVSEDMNKKLVQNFDVVEVREASSFFFQFFWHIVGDDVVCAILLVLNFGHIQRKVNHSHIVLIPKEKNPQRVVDYRPISLSNVIYKIISKVLANKLKMVLPNIISDLQISFVPGRLITDNVNVAFELFNSLRERRNGKRMQMVVKLDMSKAYDRVEWAFLLRVMDKLGFDARWSNLVMEGINIVSYSVLTPYFATINFTFLHFSK